MRISGNRRTEIAGNLEHRRIFFDSCVARVGGNAEDVSDEIQILDTGHKFVQIGIIGNICGDLLCLHGVLPHGDAVDEDIPLREIEDAARRFERGRLAGAVMADKAIDIARLDIQAQIIHSAFAALVGF